MRHAFLIGYAWRCGLAVRGLMAGLVMVATAAVTAPATATDIKVGGVGVVAPTYEGSDRYEVVGAPFAYPVFFEDSDDSALTFNGIEDVRYRLYKGSGFEAGVLGGYAFGRDQGDGPLLRGLGDIDAGVVIGGYAGVHLGPAFFDVSYHRIATGDDTGGYVRFGANIERRVAPNLKLKWRVGTTYADGDYMTTYFGVSPQQALTSVAGLPVYDADAGFKDVFAEFGATYDIDAHWSLFGGVAYKRLIGDAGDSPVIETEDQFYGVFGATYRFSLRR